MLATAYRFADDTIAEGNTFADTGGYAAFFESMYKVVANAGGNYVEIELYPDSPTHDVLGLSRMHTRRADPLVTGTAGAPLQPETVADTPPNASAVGLGATNTAGTGFGVAWEVVGRWQRLGDISYKNVVHAGVEIVSQTPDEVVFSVTYDLSVTASAVSRVVERYTVNASAVRVTAIITPQPGTAVTRIALMYPALATDGRYNTTLVFDATRSAARLTLPGDAARTGFAASCGTAWAQASCGTLAWTAVEPGTYTRNGFASIVQAAAPYAEGCTLEYVFSGATGACPAA